MDVKQCVSGSCHDEHIWRTVENYKLVDYYCVGRAESVQGYTPDQRTIDSVRNYDSMRCAQIGCAIPRPHKFAVGEIAVCPDCLAHWRRKGRLFPKWVRVHSWEE